MGNTEAAYGDDYPFVKPADILPDKVLYRPDGLSKQGVETYGRLAEAGSVLMVCIGTIGKCNFITRECSFNQQINAITPWPEVDTRLLTHFVRAPFFQERAWQLSSSTTISILNKGKWESIAVPVPPLAEQHRIVSKVDELMGLCDRLEAVQGERRGVRVRLNRSSLDRLTSVSGVGARQRGSELSAAWQRVCDHFEVLYDTPETLPDLRQTIIQLAVQGKLVPQNPNDEPAVAILSRIEDERQRRYKAKQIPKGRDPFSWRVSC
jgi:type I restriction enzyme S subunit